MRKPAVALLLFSSLALGAAAAPPDEWREAARQRALKLDATPPDKNGYPLLAKALKRGTPPGDYDALHGSWGAVDERIKPPDPALRARFDKLIPGLHAAMQKPVFHFPSQWDLGGEAEVPNLLTLRAAMCSYCIEGFTRRDLGMMLEPLGLAQKLAGQGLGQQMMVVSIENIALEALIQHTQEAALTPAQWTELQAKLSKLALPKESLVQAWDAEYGCSMVNLERLKSGKTAPPAGYTEEFAAQFPALLSEAYSRYRPYLQEGKPVSEWQAAVDQDCAELAKKGTAGPLVAEVVKSYPSTGRAWRATLQMGSAVRLLVALRKYKAAKGDYPDALAALGAGEPGWAELQYKKEDHGFSLDAPIWGVDSSYRAFP